MAGTEALLSVAGQQQSGAPGAVLPIAPTVRLSCESFDNRGTAIPIANAVVHWSAGGGRADGQIFLEKRSEADGTSTVMWTLPHDFVAQTLTASAAFPNLYPRVSFQASVLATTTTATRCQDPGGTDHGTAPVLTGDAAWRAADSPHRGGALTLAAGARLAIESGTVVCLSSIDSAEASSQVLARGSASAPIRFFGTALRVAGRLDHVQGENMPAIGTHERRLWSVLDSTFAWTAARDPLLCAQLVLSGTGGVIERSRLAGYGSAACAALRVAGPPQFDYYSDPFGAAVSARITGSLGDAISFAPDVARSVLADCEVSGSGDRGVVLEATMASNLDRPLLGVHRCNLFGNAGVALHNSAADALYARANWWGDPAGPAGPNGDGVSGPVDASQPVAGPFALGY